MNIENIRGWQISQLEKTISTLGYLIQSVPEGVLSAVRDGGDGWTVLEVLGHMSDFEAVFLERTRLTVEQDTPDLPFPDPDQLVIDNAYNTKDANAVYDQWKARRLDYLDYLKNLGEDVWERTAKHPRRGMLTLHDQFFLTVWHDANHMEQIAHILRDRDATVE